MIRSHATKCVLVQVFAGLIQTYAWSPRPPISEIVGIDNKAHKSLYPKDGPVEVLMGDQLKALQQKDPSAIWLVEYHDINCPHCWVFSGVYPFIAKAIGSPTVHVAAFNCKDSENLAPCQRAGVVNFPTVILYNAKMVGDETHVVVHSEDYLMEPLPPQKIVAWLTNYAPGKIQIVNPLALEVDASSKGSLVKPDGPPGKPGWSYEPEGTVQTRFHDAIIGFAQLLMGGYVNKSKYKAALTVVDFVSKAFSRDGSTFFADLQAKLKAKVDLEPIEFKNIMSDWVSKFKTDYLFCQTETCSVWQLLHGVSALIAIKYAPIAVAEAVPMIFFMVDEFMSCAACRQHFVKSYDRCLFGRCEVLTAGDEAAQAKALVMWLWRTHNAVSVRAISERHPTGIPLDRRWPNYQDCPGCWDINVVQGALGKLQSFAGQTDSSGKLGQSYAVFSEDKVFGFFLFTYLGEEAYLGEEGQAQVKAIFENIEFLQHRPTETYSLSAFPSVLAALAVVAGVVAFVSARRYTRATKESCRIANARRNEEEGLVNAEQVE